MRYSIPYSYFCLLARTRSQVFYLTHPFRKSQCRRKRRNFASYPVQDPAAQFRLLSRIMTADERLRFPSPNPFETPSIWFVFLFITSATKLKDFIRSR